MDLIKNSYLKYKEFILYAFFGVCTTFVNLLSYAVCTRTFHISILISTVIAWLFAVLFAYITNRKYVFISHNHTLKSILFELGSFIGCRLLTGAMDVAFMYVFVDLFRYNDIMIKVLSNVFVIMSNYIASKLLIFKLHDHIKDNLIG